MVIIYGNKCFSKNFNFFRGTQSSITCLNNERVSNATLLTKVLTKRTNFFFGLGPSIDQVERFVLFVKSFVSKYFWGKLLLDKAYLLKLSFVKPVNCPRGLWMSPYVRVSWKCKKFKKSSSSRLFWLFGHRQWWNEQKEIFECIP